MKQRWVIKIGTHSLTRGQKNIQPDVIGQLLEEIHELNQRGIEVILVSSGAVAAGKSIAPGIVDKHIFASIGQPHLINLYLNAARKKQLSIAQLLLSQHDLGNKDTFLTLQHTLQTMLTEHILPIINENDAITRDTEAALGDNDSLAAKIALSSAATRLIILSHVNGLYSEDPTMNPRARIIAEVSDVNGPLLQLASKEKSSQGSGGMVSKLKAIRLATAFGIPGHITNLDADNVLTQIADGKKIGTEFLPNKKSLHVKNRDRWILSAKISSGAITVDDGAKLALQKGKSLLAVGLRNVHGKFQAGKIIEILDLNRETIGMGIVKMDDKELTSLLQSQKVYNQEVIHADNLITL